MISDQLPEDVRRIFDGLTWVVILQEEGRIRAGSVQPRRNKYEAKDREITPSSMRSSVPNSSPPPPFSKRSLTRVANPASSKNCGSTPTWGPTGRLADLANACLECLLGLITALVRYAVKTKEANDRDDLHVSYRIFAGVLSDRKSYHLLLPTSSPIFLRI